MAGRVSVECPGCLAKLNLSDSSKLGKKIKCPKCSDVFVAKAGDEEDLDDAEEDEAPAKSAGGKKRPAPAGRKGPVKGGKSSGGGNSGALIAGGVVAVVALIGAGLFFSGFFGGNPQPLPVPVAVQPSVAPMAVTPIPAPAPPPAPPPNPAEKILGLRWMPNGTEVVMHAKVSELWQAPLLKSLVDSPLLEAPIKVMQETIGLSPADIESVTLGMADLQKMQTMAQSQMMGIPGQNPIVQALVVIRTKKPVLLDEMLKSSQAIKLAEYGSKKYFESVQGEPSGGWIPDSTTMILGPLNELKAAMDRGETVLPRKELMFMDPTSHVVLIVAPKDPKSLTAGIPMPPPATPDTPPEVAAMQKAMTESFAGFGLGVSIRGGFDLQTSLMFSNVDSAGKVKAGFDVAIAEARKKFEGFKATAPTLLADLGELLLTGLKVETQTQVVKVSTGIPDSEQGKLEQAQAMLPLLMMAGGMGAGPNPFGGDLGGNPAMSPGSPGARPRFPSARPPSGLMGGMPQGFGSKNPGETDPVNAELAEGIPEGTTLTAGTAWSRFPNFSSDGKTSQPMLVILDLKGDALGQICGFGQVSAKTMSLPDGGKLKVSRAGSLGLPNVTKSMVPFDASEPNIMEHPEGTLRLAFAVDPPPETAKSIAALEGTFKFMISENSEEFTIEDAGKAAKRPLSDPALKAAGVKLLLSKGPVGDNLTLSCAKSFFLGKAKATTPNDANAGGMTMFFMPETEKGQPVQKLQAFGQDGKFPDGMQVQFKVHREPGESTVSFKFTNVPLPSADSKPQMAAPEIAFPGVGGQSFPNGPMPPGGSFPPMNSTPPNGPMPPNSAHAQAPTAPQNGPQSTGLTMPNSPKPPSGAHGQGRTAPQNGPKQPNTGTKP